MGGDLGAQVRVWGVNARVRALTLALPLNTFHMTQKSLKKWTHFKKKYFLFIYFK